MPSNHEDSTQRIGDFLVRIGAMNTEQVYEVLTRQQMEPDRLFGEIAIELGYVNDAAIDKFLSERRSSEA
jgi:hypothetical protein